MRGLRMAAMKLPKGVTPRKFALALQAWREKKAFSQRDAAEFLTRVRIDLHLAAGKANDDVYR